MGPHFFKCGKPSTKQTEEDGLQRFNGAALFQVRKDELFGDFGFGFFQLQWGRTFSSAESGKSTRPATACARGLQWGRTFSSAERSTSVEARDWPCPLQWGRTFSSAERQLDTLSGEWRGKCFNGAALFQVRKAIPCNLLKDSWFYGGLRELFYFLD